MATPAEIVQEVLQGKWGNGETRKQKLRAAGHSWVEIQSLINIQYGGRAIKATTEELAIEVLEGRWGNGADRKARLAAAGQNYVAVQSLVNQKVAAGWSGTPTTSGGSTPAETTTPAMAAATSTVKVGTTVTMKGIDISAWQGNVNFSQVKAAGIQFVILREGFSTTIDNKFLTYAAGAKTAGLPIHGVYHFCYATTEAQAVAEAQACISHVKQANLDKNTIIFFDFEYDTVNNARKKGIVLGKNECIAFTNAFCQYIIKQGYKAGVYSNLDYYNNYYTPETINKYIYWIAQYNGGSYPLRKGAYHQWSNTGKVAGISGDVDLNNCYIIQSSSSGGISTGNGSTYTNPNPPAADTTTITTNFRNYTNKISNCGKDEYGGARGGQAGDQTGKEWWVINWYNQSWRCILRHPNEKVRLYLAELALEAANNDKVGYDQSQNQTYWNQLKAVGYWPKKITVACEADCSAGIIANTRAVGHLLNMPALQNVNATYTGNMRDGFRAAGFQVLTDSKYLTSPNYLLPGDIILNDSQHAATNLGYGAYT